MFVKMNSLIARIRQTGASSIELFIYFFELFITLKVFM